MELQVIRNKIYEIRGLSVMLDFDLAKLYGIETAQLKRAVRRNIERFEGDDFMFQVTHEELSRCHFGILNKGRGSNVKYLPFAFGELGVAMLSSVLNSNRAIEINRGIMRAFVLMRQMVIEYEELRKRIEQLEIDMNTQFSGVYQALTDLFSKKSLDETPRRPIGYKRQGT